MPETGTEPRPLPAPLPLPPDSPAVLAVLEEDAVDAPAPTALADAQRAAALSRQMSGGHMQHESTPYRQTDAGRRPEAAGSPAAARHPTTYTCPMHPEVHSAHPGQCPKCGMKLVPKAEP